MAFVLLSHAEEDNSPTCTLFDFLKNVFGIGGSDRDWGG